MKTQIISVRTGGRETVLDITAECAGFVRSASGGGDGLLHVFVPHATAGVALLELGARSDEDLLATLAGLLPADDRWRHAHGARGHGRSHVMPAFVPPYATIPVIAGRLALGTWQSVALVDLNVDNPDRQLRLSFLADAGTTVRSEEKELYRTTRAAPWRVLVLGGARSGKSERAELRLAGEPDVTYVAAGALDQVGAADPDWAARVAAHRARRPARWRTEETTDVAALLASARGAVLIDGIGTWLAAALEECGAWAGRQGWAGRLADRTDELVAAWRQTGAYAVAVSDETGFGVVPETPAGRVFRDELGRLNQALAAASDEAELVVAGRVLPLAPG